MFVLHLLLASVHTPHQVSLILQDSDKTGSSSFLVQSDKLVLVLHCPLDPVYTVVKPASYVIASLRGPSRAASQCFLPNHKLSVQNLFLQYHPLVVHYLIMWFDQNPVELDPFGLITCPAVDLHSGNLNTWTTGLGSEKRTTVTQERWKREKVRKCSVSRAAKGETWRG